MPKISIFGIISLSGRLRPGGAHLTQKRTARRPPKKSIEPPSGKNNSHTHKALAASTIFSTQRAEYQQFTFLKFNTRCYSGGNVEN